MAPQPKPGRGKPFAPGNYSKGGYSLTLRAGGAVSVRSGDWVSKYCTCLYGDPLMGWEEFGRLKGGRMCRLDDPNKLVVGETLYHIPTYAVKGGSVLPAVVSSNVWFGFGVNYGGQFFLIGTNAAHGWMYSLDSYDRSFVFSSDSWRIGPGLGGSWGVSLIIITSLPDPKLMNSHVSSGVDFEVGLGVRWGEVAKNAKHLATVRRISTQMQKSKGMQQASQNAVVKQALKLSPDDWNGIRKRIIELIDNAGMKFDSPLPCKYTIAVPVPYSALELSAFWQFTNYQIERISGEKQVGPKGEDRD